MTRMPIRTSGSLHLRLRVQPHRSRMRQRTLQPVVKNTCMKFEASLMVIALMIVLMLPRATM